MTERKNSILIGAFVIGAIIIAVVGTLWFAAGGLSSERSKVVMVFDGSVHGLTIGAPVALRGANIGQVTDIDVIFDAKQITVTMLVTAEILTDSIQMVGAQADLDKLHSKQLIDSGLRAKLATQSMLTGLLYIQLDFLPGKEANLAEIDSPYTQIPTIPTELEVIRRSIENIDFAAISNNLQRIATGLDGLLNSEDMQALPSSLHSSLAAVEGAGSSLKKTLDDNSPALAQILEAGGETMATLKTELPKITGSLEESLLRLETTLSTANDTLERIEVAASADSQLMLQLSQTMQDLSLTARSLRTLALSLEEHPESLIRGRKGD
jgi:paraquat-inducible protein B